MSDTAAAPAAPARHAGAMARRGAKRATMNPAAIALLAAGTALLLAATAQAQAVDPLPLTRAVPANRAVVPPTPTGGIPWQVAVTGVPADAQVLVTVSSSPATGSDGTLLDANRVDFFFLSEGTSPGSYAGRSDPGPNAWSADAATYYWQVRATWTDAAGVLHTAASTVQRLVIGTAAPPGAPPSGTGPSSPSAARSTLAMSSLDATYYVRTAIRRRTKRAPTALRYGCARVSSRSFRCRPAWRDSRNAYTARVTFTHARAGGRLVARGTFAGRRASRQCTRTSSVKSCGRAFRWRTVTAARPTRARRSG
jgi:hypothetical protein